jgi:hypothetical protein
MAKRLLTSIVLGLFLLTSSAFTLRAGARYLDSSAIEKHTAVTTRKGSRGLSMTPRILKLKSREGSPMMMKQTKNKKCYNVPGYVKGKLDLIRAVFRSHSSDGKMTYNAFLDSKYLRYWPGKPIRKIFLRLKSTCQQRS